MTEKGKALLVGGVTFLLTAIVTSFREFDTGYVKIIWFAWVFHSWNYFAFAYDRDMWPWIFVELYGQGKGNPTERMVFFWGTAAVYLMFLALMAFADK
jgi:hypothetical protein